MVRLRRSHMGSIQQGHEPPVMSEIAFEIIWVHKLYAWFLRGCSTASRSTILFGFLRFGAR